MGATIEETDLRHLEEHARIPIRFEVRSRLDLDALKIGRLLEVPIHRYVKDYDALESPLAWPQRFDTGNWRIIRALDDKGQEIGGAVIAWNSDMLDLLEDRNDIALVWDIRVHPGHRGCGIGKKLFTKTIEWARQHGCTAIRVETQDTNVAACKFYRAMGCSIHRIEEDAYPGLNETVILWELPL